MKSKGPSFSPTWSDRLQVFSFFFWSSVVSLIGTPIQWKVTIFWLIKTSFWTHHSVFWWKSFLCCSLKSDILPLITLAAEAVVRNSVLLSWNSFPSTRFLFYITMLMNLRKNKTKLQCLKLNIVVLFRNQISFVCFLVIFAGLTLYIHTF